MAHIRSNGEEQVFTKEDRCPVCGGYDAPAYPHPVCDGYISKDRTWVYCKREFRAVGREELARPHPHRGAIRWLVEGRLPVCGASMLLGEAGMGKSTLARELALSVARGRPWLGFRARRGSVLYVDLEGDAQEAFARRQLAVDEPVQFLTRMRGRALLKTIRRRAERTGPALIVIDPLDVLLEEEEEVLGDHSSSSPLDRILDLARSAKSHVLLVHSLPETQVGQMGALLCSTSRSIETLLMVHRAGGHGYLRSVQQAGDDLHQPILIPSYTEPVRPVRRKVDVPVPTDEILRALRAASELLTPEQILQHVHASRGQVYLALAELKDRGRIIRSGRGTRVDPYRYTGCDLVTPSAETGWLRRVKPWVKLERKPACPPVRNGWHGQGSV